MIGKWLPTGYRQETNPFALKWWPLVHTDNLLFHTVLLASAFDLESHSGKPNTFYSERYTAECMQLLRARLRDPVCAASNQTIGAVATLASLAVSDPSNILDPSIDIPKYGRGNMKEVRTHMEGLQTMVIVRGGMGNIKSSSQVTASVAFWGVATSIPEIPVTSARSCSLTISTPGIRSLLHLNLSFLRKPQLIGKARHGGLWTHSTRPSPSAY